MSLASLKRPLCRTAAVDPLICPAKQPKLASKAFFSIESLVSDRPKSDDEQSLGSDGSVHQHSPKSEVDALSHIVADNVHDLKTEVKAGSPSADHQQETKSQRLVDFKDSTRKSTSTTSAAAAAGAWEKNWAEPGRSESLRHVRCHLEDRELWREFHQLGTEMIITKSGRRMFPAVKARFEGCDPDAVYYVLMDVVPVDNHRYRYVYNKSSWQQAGKAEPNPPSRLYKNPDCPYTGKQLTTQTVTFEKAKLTNNDVGDGKVGHLILNSMHKYVPRIHLVRRDKSQADKHGTAPHDLSGEEYWTFTFKEMEFMAVTAYQNQLVTQKKIEKNPFAKGFRDPHGRGDRMSDQPGRTPDVMQSPLQGVHMWQQQQLAAERLRHHLLANIGGHNVPFGMPWLPTQFAPFLPPHLTPAAGFQVDPAALQQLFMMSPMHFAAAAAMQSGAFPSSSTGGQLPPSGRISGRDDDEDADGNSSSAFTPVRSASTTSSLIGTSPADEPSVRKAPSRCRIPRLAPGRSPAPPVR